MALEVKEDEEEISNFNILEYQKIAILYRIFTQLFTYSYLHFWSLVAHTSKKIRGLLKKAPLSLKIHLLIRTQRICKRKRPWPALVII